MAHEETQILAGDVERVALVHVFAPAQPSSSQAVERTGSTDLDNVIGVLRSNKFNTVLGDIGFDGKGDVTAPGYVWYVWDKGQYGYR